MNRKLLTALCTTAAWVALAGTASAESSFGCTGLEENKELPAIEGRDGVFFRINADLRMNHSFSDEIVAQLAELSKALAKNGTTLIFVPIPTKSVTMPEYLPDTAHLYGFDLVIATEVHLDILRRVETAGVVTVDARDAMLNMPPEELAFFKADFHWSAAGARETASAIAETIRGLPEYATLEPTVFTTEPLKVEVAFSGMRRVLQKHCIDTLPEAETMTYKTTQQSPDAGVGGLDLFGADEAGVPIVLLGTSFSDSPINNFPGFLAEYAGLEVVNYALTGGNQFGAMLSYLTSTEYAEAPPRFLVWENPIYNNLAQYGDQPMRELIAAAGQTCVQPLEAEVDAAGKTLTVKLDGYGFGPEDTILVDTNQGSETKVNFVFQSAKGLERIKTIERGERSRRTGRFYMPLSGLWDEGPVSVRIELTQPLTTEPAIFACLGQLKEET